jgi:hypothetical protein
VSEKCQTNIIVTKMMGTWYQAECLTCKWLAPGSRSTRARAEQDAEQHKREARHG